MCVPQTCTRVCTVNKMVPCVQNVVRTVCVPTPCVETRTVMKTVVTCKPVTTVTRKCVDMGHYECKQVPCRQGCLAKMRNKHKCCCECCCVPMKTVRVWCPNKVWVETPCTKMVRCCRVRALHHAGDGLQDGAQADHLPGVQLPVRAAAGDAVLHDDGVQVRALPMHSHGRQVRALPADRHLLPHGAPHRRQAGSLLQHLLQYLLHPLLQYLLQA